MTMIPGGAHGTGAPGSVDTKPQGGTRGTLLAVVNEHPVWFAILLPVVLGVVFVVVLIILAIISHVAAVPLAAPNDLLVLLATLAGLMGTAFVVGGLVIALAAVVTLLSINERVRSTIQKELPDLKAQADHQIQAYLLLQASGAEDVERAAALVEEALRLYPDAKHARSDLGLRLNDIIVTNFIHQHGDPDTVYAAPPHPWEPTPPFSEAVRWLRAALEHGDTRDGRVPAALATVYAAQRYHDSMIAMVRMVRDTYPDQLSSLKEQERMAVLAYACVPSHERLCGLGVDLDMRLPMELKDVREWIVSIDLADDNKGPHYAEFYVVGRFSRWGNDIGRFPMLVRILLVATDAGGRNGRLSLAGPTLIEHSDLFDNSRPGRPVDDIIAELEPLVHFICPVERGRRRPSLPFTYVTNLE